jgi:hypothetical protein
MNQPLSIGARLLRYIPTWTTIGQAYLIQRGIQSEWKGGPPPCNVGKREKRPYGGVMHTNFLKQLQQEIDEDVIVQVRKEDCKFISATFLVPKRGGEWRKVIDCREVNKYIKDQTFIMEDHRTARTLIERGDYATSIDIKEAYHHIPVATEFQPYLSFAYAGKYYQYRGMPFGVKHAPRIFTQVMRAAIREIRVKWSVRSILYLDDLLFLGREKEKLQRETEEIAEFL